jgi:hypothetical protein
MQDSEYSAYDHFAIAKCAFKRSRGFWRCVSRENCGEVDGDDGEEGCCFYAPRMPCMGIIGCRLNSVFLSFFTYKGTSGNLPLTVESSISNLYSV